MSNKIKSEMGPLTYSPYAQRSTMQDMVNKLDGLVEKIEPNKDDPAWQPPTDLLKTTDIKAQANIIYREIPLTTVSTNWGVADIRNALESHSMGLFEHSAQLVDAIVGDDRVQATMGSRTGGLLGRPIKFKKAIFEDAKKQELADECYEAFISIWEDRKSVV